MATVGPVLGAMLRRAAVAPPARPGTLAVMRTDPPPPDLEYQAAALAAAPPSPAGRAADVGRDRGGGGADGYRGRWRGRVRAGRAGPGRWRADAGGDDRRRLVATRGGGALRGRVATR
ncbi:MAG: hypothetical protein ACR2GH_07630 [Pseudonocardia sp.]